MAVVAGMNIRLFSMQIGSKAQLEGGQGSSFAVLRVASAGLFFPEKNRTTMAKMLFVKGQSLCAGSPARRTAEHSARAAEAAASEHFCRPSAASAVAGEVPAGTAGWRHAAAAVHDIFQTRPGLHEAFPILRKSELELNMAPALHTSSGKLRSKYENLQQANRLAKSIRTQAGLNMLHKPRDLFARFDVT